MFSIFHSTATVKGAINTTRNVLGERAHTLSDDNLNARKVVKSAVKNSNAKCCYDYNFNEKIYTKNWKNARGNYDKALKSAPNISNDETYEDEMLLETNLEENEGSRKDKTNKEKEM